MDIFGPGLNALERSLDLRMENQRIIASNLANIDTPGYVAQQLDFQASMEEALMGAAQPAVVAPSAEPAGLDGNNVDLDGELGRMSQNRVMYSVVSQIVSAKFRQVGTIFDKEN